MVEIRKFEAGRFRCEEEPLAIYHFNHTEIALTHFLEENFETVSNQSPWPLSMMVVGLKPD